MSGYTKKNLKQDVENAAPKFGMPEELAGAIRPAGRSRARRLGLSHMKLEPNFRIPFGHKHQGQEEVYVIVRGSARIKVEDELVEVGEWDAIRFDKDTMRNVEAGPDGVEYLAFGAATIPATLERSRLVVQEAQDQVGPGGAGYRPAATPKLRASPKEADVVRHDHRRECPVDQAPPRRLSVLTTAAARRRRAGLGRYFDVNPLVPTEPPSPCSRSPAAPACCSTRPHGS